MPRNEHENTERNALLVVLDASPPMKVIERRSEYIGRIIIIFKVLEFIVILLGCIITRLIRGRVLLLRSVRFLMENNERREKNTG